MAASYPKPDDQRVNRVAPKFDWTVLPARFEGPVPSLPTFRVWQPQTVAWWSDLWARPQAQMWEKSGESLWSLACLYDDLFASRAEVAKVSGEIRQHEDRHGLNPKAMLQLRWRVGDEQTAAAKPKAGSRFEGLKVVSQ